MWELCVWGSWWFWEVTHYCETGSENTVLIQAAPELELELKMYIINSSCLVPAAMHKTGSIVIIKYECTSNSFLLSELMSSEAYLCLCQVPVVKWDNFTESSNVHYFEWCFPKMLYFVEEPKIHQYPLDCLFFFLIAFLKHGVVSVQFLFFASFLHEM